MTDTAAMKPVEIVTADEALELVDNGLAVFSGRQLVSAAEVTDLLLDLRSVIEAR